MFKYDPNFIGYLILREGASKLGVGLFTGGIVSGVTGVADIGITIETIFKMQRAASQADTTYCHMPKS
jgi:hypothetical protein